MNIQTHCIDPNSVARDLRAHNMQRIGQPSPEKKWAREEAHTVILRMINLTSSRGPPLRNTSQSRLYKQSASITTMYKTKALGASHAKKASSSEIIRRHNTAPAIAITVTAVTNKDIERILIFIAALGTPTHSFMKTLHSCPLSTYTGRSYHGKRQAGTLRSTLTRGR